jgi:hypothetical protein
LFLGTNDRPVKRLDNGRLSGTTRVPASDYAGSRPSLDARFGHVIRYICCGGAVTGKILPLRERSTSTIQAAAVAFLSSPRLDRHSAHWRLTTDSDNPGGRATRDIRPIRCGLGRLPAYQLGHAGRVDLAHRTASSSRRGRALAAVLRAFDPAETGSRPLVTGRFTGGHHCRTAGPGHCCFNAASASFQPQLARSV